MNERIETVDRLERALRVALALGSLTLCLLALGSCRAVPPISPDPYESTDGRVQPRSLGDEIIICGKRFATGAPVVLWFDPGGYDGYDQSIRPGTSPEYADPASGRRYDPGRRERGGERRQLVPQGTGDVDELARVVDQFVIHYDVCGVSRTCFEVLQHDRGLSVHFLLDIDGTIYQTLDVRETCWHATKANPHSVGVEIAQIGAWPPEDDAALEAWYSTDPFGPYLDLPEHLGGGGVRTPDFLGRPARRERLEGVINGRRLVQYDFTLEQYDSLARLIATLARRLPRLRVQVPRDSSGAVRDGVLGDVEYDTFAGILGHYHVQLNKSDPGPAFDWDRLLRDIERYL